MRFWRRHDVPTDEGLARDGVDRAYRKGREDEARRHRSHPILSALVLAAAVIGVGTIYLAAREGSFTQGGQVIDQKLANTANTAHVASQSAAAVIADSGQTAPASGQQLHQHSSGR